MHIIEQFCNQARVHSNAKSNEYLRYYTVSQKKHVTLFISA